VLLDADGSSSGHLFPQGGRRRATGEIHWRGAWLAPMLRGDADQRDTPSDTAAIQDRVRALDADLASGSRVPGRLARGAGARRAAHDAGLTRARTRASTWRAELETPVAAPVGATFSAQRRDTRDEATGERIRHDLASTRLRAEW